MPFVEKINKACLLLTSWCYPLWQTGQNKANKGQWTLVYQGKKRQTDRKREKEREAD